MANKEWGSVADWLKAAITLAGVLGALASYGLLPDEYGWVWPVLALVALVGIALVIARLPSARRASRAKGEATREAHAKGDCSVAIAGDVKDTTITTGDMSEKS